MTRTQTTALALMPQDDPLELSIKKSRYSRALMNMIFRTPGSYLGKYSFNWMAAGALADMIEAILTSNDEVYAERRKLLRKLGMTFRPRPLHFDVLRVIVRAFPLAVHRTEIQAELSAKYPDLTLADVRAATDYLKDFTVKICGFSILPDFEGGVSLADIDTRMKHHIHARLSAQGIHDAEERNGIQALRAFPGVRELPAATPMLALDFTPEAQELPDASD